MKTTRSPRDRTLYRISYWIAVYMVGLALAAGYSKILYPDQFALAVFRYHLLPYQLVNITALYITWLEAVCAVILLFIPRWRRAALWIVLALLAVLTVAVATGILHGTAFACGCFSLSPQARPMDWFTVLRNCGLITLCLMALVGGHRARKD
ncbi:MAG: hypothetical protein K9M45_06175 [Kiritimatiellales bacterium]|nr:hypothetical protein [Kiritimatiellales bacterium]